VSEGRTSSFAQCTMLGSGDGRPKRHLLGSRLDRRALLHEGEGYVLGYADGSTLSFGSFPPLAGLQSGSSAPEVAEALRRAPVGAITRYRTGILLGTTGGAVVRVDRESSALVVSEESEDSASSLVALSCSDSSGDSGWYLRSNGSIQTFGDAQWLGDPSGRVGDPATALCRLPTEYGYAVATSRGQVFRFGRDARELGPPLSALNGSVVSISWSPSDGGYWLVASDGGVFCFGDAGFFGSLSMASREREPATVVGMASLPSSEGYWIADSAGAVSALGRAAYLGRGEREADGAVCIGIA
jgi:hypothetical protein